MKKFTLATFLVIIILAATIGSAFDAENLQTFADTFAMILQRHVDSDCFDSIVECDGELDGEDHPQESLSSWKSMVPQRIAAAAP